ncbi:type II toxin-antitoxin system RelE/ParE family toxin [Algiphilus sp. NNCM1]|nr:type II toxin-antitoxin system RelE/ParE family toxin [Algiphilus acroporae]
MEAGQDGRARGSEIRIKADPNDQYRVLYVAEIEGRVLVLHAFQKKTQRAAKTDLDLARARLSVALMELRK